MAAAVTQKKRRTHHIPGGKITLDSPFDPNWPAPINSDNSKRILLSLIQEVAPIYSKRIQPKEELITIDSSTTTSASTPSTSGEKQSVQKEICFGLNQVTKGLERKSLSFIV